MSLLISRSTITASNPFHLCSRIQVHTCLLTCQEALSQRSLLAVLPWACSRVQHHSRNWVVRALTGRPVTNGGFTLDKRERRK